MLLTRVVIGQSTHEIPKAFLSTRAAFCDIIEDELNSIREAGTWKGERIITSKQSASITVSTRKDKVLNFCANNYLGLSVRLTVNPVFGVI